jgi:hypothetical protein
MESTENQFSVSRVRWIYDGVKVVQFHQILFWLEGRSGDNANISYKMDLALRSYEAFVAVVVVDIELRSRWEKEEFGKSVRRDGSR